jgi:general nucleoside transport system permease protein
VSEGVPPTAFDPDPQQEQPHQEPGGYAPSVAARFDVFSRAGGVVTPIITTLLAFLIGGLVVLITTGHNPLSTYRAIFDGTGLGWFVHVGNHHIDIPFTSTHVWFPWNTNSFLSRDAYALQQTLLLTTTLIFTGLAVAFAFRCGLFNIGGQGQYIAGSLAAVWVGSSFASMAHLPHVLLAVCAAGLAGALLAGIAGFLKATVGAHEVVVTIMLNWIMFWGGQWALGEGGPLNHNPATSTSADVTASGKLPTFWGIGVLQGAHVGLFMGIAALIVYALILNRTTLGYEVRAVGHNPDAARYGGINVGRSFFLAMAIAGTFAGLGGAMDVLGWEYRVAASTISLSQIGFLGIAAALLGRNTAIGTGLAALLFGALLTGTSQRNLDPSILKPELASNLTLLIQGLVVLFVGADLLILSVWNARKKLKPTRRRAGAEPEAVG